MSEQQSKMTEEEERDDRAAKLEVTPLFGRLAPFKALHERVFIQGNENTYRPKSENILYDWVNRVALEALLAYRDQLTEQGKVVRTFCTLGTGTGCDALAAIEILNPAQLVITDLHSSVVQLAASNITANVVRGVPVEVGSEVGSLCTPLLGKNYQFDLVYENLPNLPLDDEQSVLSGQNSSSYYTSSQFRDIPAAVRECRLVLHFAALLQAKELLAKQGAVLCSIGARCPIDDILGMVRAAGYEATPLIYTWKMQSEPEDIIGGYAAAQAETGRRFVFYTQETLEEVFGSHTPSSAAAEYAAIERQLKPFEIDAIRAMDLLREGQSLGHAVVVVKATPQ